MEEAMILLDYMNNQRVQTFLHYPFLLGIFSISLSVHTVIIPICQHPLWLTGTGDDDPDDGPAIYEYNEKNQLVQAGNSDQNSAMSAVGPLVKVDTESSR
jgi:hypothetical protein